MSDDSNQREPYFEQPQETEQPHYTVGRRLREARETFDLDLREVAAQLRIRPFYLEAIEEARYQDLPGATYAIGFVRAYADYLRLDSKDLVDRFKAEVEGFDTRRSLQFPVPPQEGRVPGVAILLVALLLGAAGYGVWYYLGQEGRTFTDVVDPLPQELAELAGAPEEPAQEPEAAPAPQTDPAPQPQPQPVPTPTPTPGQTASPEAALTPESPAREEAEAAPETIEVAPAPGVMTQSEEAAAAAESVESVEPATPEAPQAASGESQTLGTLPADAPIPQGPAEEPLPDPAAELLAQDQTSAPLPIEEEAPAEPEEQPAAAAEAPPAPEPVAPPPPAPAVEDSAEEPQGRVYGAVNESARVILLAETDSWVEVRDAGGRLVLSRVLREGDSFRVPDQEGLVMMTGNAGGLRITVDGQALPKLGEQGQVRRDIALAPDQLLSLLPQ
ncbi:helix-turn-helix domain-containing protein [Limibacillus halophilus]